jgi:hypothetical protein
MVKTLQMVGLGTKLGHLKNVLYNSKLFKTELD